MSDDNRITITLADGSTTMRVHKRPRDYDDELQIAQERVAMALRDQKTKLEEAEYAFEAYVRAQLELSPEVEIFSERNTSLFYFCYRDVNFAVVLDTTSRDEEDRYRICRARKGTMEKTMFFYTSPEEFPTSFEADIPKEVVAFCKNIRHFRENCPWIQLPLKY